MFAGFGTPEDTNRRFKYLLAHGQTGLSTAFDMPTLMGYDPDHPRALGEVGREGVSRRVARRHERLFDDIPLDEVTTSMTINAPAVVLLALYVAVAEKRGHRRPTSCAARCRTTCSRSSSRRRSGSARPRPHAHHPRHARVVHARDAAVEHDLDQRLSHPRSRRDRRAGAGVHARRRHRLRAAGPRRGPRRRRRSRRACRSSGTSTTTSSRRSRSSAPPAACGRSIMRERFGAKNPSSWLLRTHAQTAGVSLMAQQPLNNVVRTTLQALAAVLGGTQSLHTNSFDETYALPTEEAATLALRTQQIIAEETGVAGGRRSARRQLLRRDADRSDAKPRRGSTSTRSTRWAASCAPSRRAIRSARSRTSAYGTSGRSIAASGRSSASTSTSVAETAPDPDAEDRHAARSRRRSRMCRRCARRDVGAPARALEGVRRRVRRRRQPHGRGAEQRSKQSVTFGRDLSSLPRRLRRISGPRRGLVREERETREWRRQESVRT